MSELNKVDSVQAVLYAGDDQPFILRPDSTLDDSGVPVSDWTVVIRLYLANMDLAKASHVHTIEVAATYFPAVDPDPEYFRAVVLAASSINMLPGLWTLDWRRTNSTVSKLLARIAPLRVSAAIT